MKKSDLAVIVLAAGKGTRMKSDKPKVMHQLAGWPMVNHVLHTAKALSPKRVVVVISAGMEEIAVAARNIIPEVEIAVQKEQRGTGDAVKAAEAALKDHKGNYLVLYADTPLITSKTLEKLVAALDNNTVAILGMKPADPLQYGRLKVKADGALEAIIEYKDATAAERKIGLVNAGMMAVGPELFPYLKELKANNAQKEYYLTDLVAIANKKKKRCAVVEGGEEELSGINSRAELAQAEAMLQKRLRQKAFECGVTMVAPETVFFAADTKLGRDIVIQPNVYFGPGVEIENDVEIRSFSHIEGAYIGKHCIIGPFARLRPGAYLSGNNKIGNFVEVKQATLGNGAQASHLSYLGDAKIGRDVNIGAGTVTCNYDGYSKYETRIEDDAFIGSNTSLVAPVTVGEGSIIGAGSTITQSVGADSLALTRPLHIEKSGWAKEFRAQKRKKPS